MMEFRILGCSGGIGSGLRTTCLLLDEDVLIDVGTGVGDLSLEELSRIQHIFLTHSHLDHIAGLPLLVDTLFGVKSKPLTIHALPETIETLKQHIFNWQIWPDFAELPSAAEPSMRYVPMRYGDQIELGHRSIRMLEASHTVPAAGYSISTENSAIAFSGDTSFSDSMWDALNGISNLKLLIVECAFANEQQELSDLAKHYCPKYLAEDIKKLKNNPKIAITHLKPGYEEQIMSECEAAMPGRDLLQLRTGDRFKF